MAQFVTGITAVSPSGTGTRRQLTSIIMQGTVSTPDKANLAAVAFPTTKDAGTSEIHEDVSTVPLRLCLTAHLPSTPSVGRCVEGDSAQRGSFSGDEDI